MSTDLQTYTDGDVDTNRSANPDFQSIIDARYSRRSAIFSGLAATLTAALPSMALVGCGEDAAEVLPITAGNAQSSSGRVVSLTGTVDMTNVSSVAFSQVSGPPVTLTKQANGSATFLAPSVAATTPLEFNYTATTKSGNNFSAKSVVTVDPSKLGFAAVPKNLTDIVSVPAGYSVTVLYRLGDPINAATPAYSNLGTDTSFAARAGDHHDALYYYGLAATGNARDDNNSNRGVLVMNHENITQRFLHPAGWAATAPRLEAEALKEMEAHGVSSVEVIRNAAGAWSYVQASPLNVRITPLSPMTFTGPVAGNALLQTVFSPTGVAGRGTINNCANGYTGWGTNLTCEENWAGYFRRRTATDNPLRTAREIVAFSRYGVGSSTGNYGWAAVVAADPASTIYRRWTTEVSGATATADFRNEVNQFGWVLETDPYDPASTPRKRTALGRMNHEGCWPSNFVVGRRPAFYMGDDARGEYIYKFVSSAAWVAADAQSANRFAIGDKYLDTGILYVAKINADGSGQWLPLVFGTAPLTAANAAYAFADQADVLTHVRLAGDALGATKMDRPEWTAINPKTGELYVTLTNNNATLRPLAGTDAANPRHYNDPRGTTANRGNPNGHIIRMKEAGDNSEALTFTWDIYAFGAGSDLDAANVNISGLDATNDFSSPDGLWFARPTNASGLVNPVLWVQTDDGAFTDVTNCMMLAAMPGVTGDGANGGVRTITNTDSTGATRTQETRVGKVPGATLIRFLVGPNQCEITGVDSTPDGRSLFVNIQHPGEDTDGASKWPDSQANPAAVGRPRSATIVITKNDGGVVGL